MSPSAQRVAIGLVGTVLAAALFVWLLSVAAGPAAVAGRLIAALTAFVSAACAWGGITYLVEAVADWRAARRWRD